MGEVIVKLEDLMKELQAKKGSREEGKINEAWAALKLLHEVYPGQETGIEECELCTAMRMARLFLGDVGSRDATATKQEDKSGKDIDNSEGCGCCKPRIVINGGDPWCTNCEQWRYNAS